MQYQLKKKKLHRCVEKKLLLELWIPQKNTDPFET